MNEQGWIEHDGGECPLPIGTRYERRYRNGMTQTATVRDLADDWNSAIWTHDPESPELDIIAYRIVEPGK